ncbi:MAG TPA: hypothetical protein VHM31_12460 [Polyangia bacterium]|nr:hypothetical protein [Polyangia bacterium]HVY38746.1 hypothetical protein [Polyangia bacterium]
MGVATWPGAAGAEDLKPLPHPIGAPDSAVAAARPASSAGASPWTPLANQPGLFNGASSPILLTDGTVLVQDTGFPDWWRLTPDETGSYVNGTWAPVASLPAGYSPLYHSSAVLPDGRLIIEGGEYLLSDDHSAFVGAETAQGAIYDPVADTWTPVEPPPFFNSGFLPQTIGDAQSVVLANGVYMQANCCTTESALLDARTLTWRPTGQGKRDVNSEEGWTLLPGGNVLTVDAYVFGYDVLGMASELYDWRTGTWSSAGSTIVQLWDSAAACIALVPPSDEVGPGVLRPDGTVFYAGANRCGAGHTAIYDSRTGRWRAGPDFPDAVSIADGPAALETNGKVLMMASPFFVAPSEFFEWDGRRLAPVAAPPRAPFDASFFGNMLVLPTGQILLTDFSNDVEIFTPGSAGHDHGDREHDRDRVDPPEIVDVPTRLARGGSYILRGRGLNGVSQGAAYGDDAQSATNYPLVRITNSRTGHVFYSRTHDHSSMAVASNELVHTRFDVPRSQERGRSTLEVVANGIASCAIPVFVE